MTFAADLTAFANARKLSIDNAVREVVTELHGEVDRRSPVGNRELWASNMDRATRGLPPQPEGYVGGHFRINNQYNFGSLPDSEVAGEDPSGSNSTAIAKAGIYSSPAAGVHYIANRVPYAMALENGHSTQAPQGIYGLAMQTVVGQLHKFGFKV